MDLIALAIAPGIAICLFIFHRDAYNREPKLNLFVSFILGAVIVFPVAYTELYFNQFPDQYYQWCCNQCFSCGSAYRRIGKIHYSSFLCLSQKKF